MDGSEIRAARKRAGLSQTELGEQVGASLRTVGNWERGKTDPKGSIDRIIAVLGPWLSPESAPPPAAAGVRQDVTLGDLSGLVERVERLERFRQEAEGRLATLEGAPTPPPDDKAGES